MDAKEIIGRTLVHAFFYGLYLALAAFIGFESAVLLGLAGILTTVICK
jgi:hypothetical protein